MAIENVINDILQNLRPRCAVSNFASIARILSQPRVASALSGKEPFKNEDALAHLAVARKLKALGDMAAPLPLDYSKTELIRAALDCIDDGSLHISIHKEEKQIREKGYWVRLKSGSFFSRQDRETGKPLVQMNVVTGLPIFSLTAANEMVAVLAKAGFPAYAQENRNFRGDGIIESVDVVWSE